ncbi:MAG: PQQ-binding-like beta-propeller repeat protein [Planctomycetota bacterium]
MPDFQTQARESEFLHGFRRTLVGRDDVLTFGSNDAGPAYSDHLVCLDRATGALRWEFGGGDSSLDLLGPACADLANVYVGRSNGVLYALRRGSGTQAWHLPRGRGICVPCFHAGRLLVSEAPVNILQVDPASGEIVDDTRVALHKYPSDLRAVLVPHERLLFQITSDGTLTELSKNWPGRWISDAAAHVLAPTAIYVATPAGIVRSLDLGDGSELWSADGPAEVKRLVTDGKTLWTSSSGGAIGALEALTGEPRWSRKMGTAASMVEWNGRLYLDMNAKIAVLDGETGESVGEIAVEGAPYAAMAVEDETLFVAHLAEPEVVMHAVPVGAGSVKWRTVIGGYGLS